MSRGRLPVFVHEDSFRVHLTRESEEDARKAGGHTLRGVKAESKNGVRLHLA